MLDFSQIIAFAVALSVAVFIPGPGITTLVARSVGGGTGAGFATLAGLITGDLVYLSFAVFGLAILAKSYVFLFVLIKVAATAYLLFWRGVFGMPSHKFWWSIKPLASVIYCRLFWLVGW